MDILFLILGAILWFIIPVLRYNIYGTRVALFLAIMIVFFIFVLAYGILSIYKYFLAKYNFIIQNKIVSWNTEYVQKKKSIIKEFALCGAFGIFVGLVLIFKQVPYITALLSALGGAFVSFGWVLMGTKRFENKKMSVDNFLLSHIGLIYQGKAEIFNGTTKGILSATEKDGYLVLEIVRKKQTETIKILIPNDKKEEVNKFLEDMKEFFDENKQETT